MGSWTSLKQQVWMTGYGLGRGTGRHSCGKTEHQTSADRASNQRLFFGGALSRPNPDGTPGTLLGQFGGRGAGAGAGDLVPVKWIGVFALLV